MDPLTTFGRDEEQAILRKAFADTARGVGGCVVLTGAAGIGKSHLLRAAVEEARADGLAVATRAAFELDRAAPFITLASALQQIEPATSAFDWIADTGESQFQTLDRLAGALEDFVAERPLVIAIDDAQWTDEFSALAMRELVTALASSPVRWLFARRPRQEATPGQQLVDRLIREGTPEIVLGRLDEGAVAGLCSQAVGARVDNTVLALAAGCDGSPLQLEQLMRALLNTRQLLIRDGVATVVGDQLPSSFITIVEQTLSSLSEQTRRMLEAGSVLHGRFSADTLARLLGTRPAALLPSLYEATSAKVLVDEGDGLAFGHDLVRKAIYGTVGGAAKALYHREAAVVGREEDRSPVEVAEHLLRSGRSTREAATMLREAALEVAPAAPSTAADLMVHALDVLGADDPDRPELAADTVGLLARAGRLERAQRLGEAALYTGLEPPTEAALLLGLAEAFKHAGRNRSAVEYASRGLSYPDVPEAVRARLWAVRAHALFYTGDLTGTDRSGTSAYRSGMAAEEYGAAVFGLTARTLAAQAEGRLDDALAHATEATEIADGIRGEAAHWHPRIWLGDAQAALDRFEEASATFRRGREESERLGTAWSTPLWHYYHAALLAASGRLDEAVAETDAGVKIAETHAAYALAVPLLAGQARLSVLRDDTAQAREYIGRMRHWLAEGITTAPEDATWAEGMLLEATAGPDAALQTLTVIYDAMPRRSLLLVQDPGAAATLVRVALLAHSPERAEVVATTASDLADRNPTVQALTAAAAHAEGLLRRDLGLLREAIDGYRGIRRPLALAAALEDAADATPDPVRARKLAEEALAIATDCGAERARRRLEQRLGRERVRQSAPPSVLERLSPAERPVAILVARGRSNREIAEELFLSRHTVDSHLRKIFVKLGINNRSVLARLVGDEGSNSAST
ncbi:AAA family ATPase [Phytohabitans sp. ZYX-F-186]|uniref:AAA family ATPase n=1 Tax=Phytohabitans maris TaxID=3071409 RepID=A0ABU0ZF42_9ACTN|nr:AAA family ATPase [Phytohabitans sp. ZYX-F-186]MDQ7905673.1 AAA family ATPase [Phytohabitans sp. ZYX-F-186]